VKRGEGNTNSPELSLLKILPLAYHHSHFLAATFDFTSFFTMAFFGGRTLFLQLGCFGLDISDSEPTTQPSNHMMQLESTQLGHVN